MSKTILAFRFSSGKFGGKHRNQQTIICQVLAELNKIWSCLIFIKLYFSISLHFRIENHIFIMTINLCKSVVKEPSYLIFSIHTNFLTCNKTELNAGCSFRCILKLQKFIRKQKNRDASKIAFYSISKQFAEIFIISKCKNFLYNMAIK